MQKLLSLPASAFAAILSFGGIVANGLHRVSADRAAICVLSGSAALAWLVADVAQGACQCNRAVVGWLKKRCSSDDINFCAHVNSSFEVERDSRKR